MFRFVFVLALVGFVAAAQIPASTTKATSKAPAKAPAAKPPAAKPPVAKVPAKAPAKAGAKEPNYVKLRSPFEDVDSGSSRNDRQIITTKISLDGTPEKQCECTAFFLCPEGSAYDLAANGIVESCENDTYICCNLKPSGSGSEPPVTVNEGTAKTEALTDNDGKACSCVSFDNCHNEAYVKDYGAGTIQIRITACDTSQICCPHEYLSTASPYHEVTESTYSSSGFTNYNHYSTPEPESEHTIGPSEHGSNTGFSSSGHEYVTHGPVEVTSQIISQTTPDPEQCACVPFSQCKNETYVHDYGKGAILVRSQFCDVTELCCPLDYIVSKTVPEYSTSNPVEPVPQELLYECGIRKETTTRVSDGVLDKTATSFGEFPWMIMILKSTKEKETEFVCGGSLLSANIVLTAAHCVKDIEKQKLVIRGGEYDVHLESPMEQAPHQDRHLIDIIIHPFYHPDVLFNDMALLVVDEPFTLKPHIAPVCMPLPDTKFADPSVYDPDKCIATGWGKDLHGSEGTFQTTLKKVELGLVDREECEKKLRKTKLGSRFKLHVSFLCAGGQVGKDTCQGDGGGPLFCALRDNPNRFVQVGIVSWGIGCGDKYPAVYTSLYANKKWLSVEYNMFTVFQPGSSPEYGAQARRYSPKK